MADEKEAAAHTGTGASISLVDGGTKHRVDTVEMRADEHHREHRLSVRALRGPRAHSVQWLPWCGLPYCNPDLRLTKILRHYRSSSTVLLSVL